MFHATEPAELLVTDGPPQWTPINDTGLDYAANTTQELFRADDGVYLSLSGRWFGAFDLKGPWSQVRELPASVRRDTN